MEINFGVDIHIDMDLAYIQLDNDKAYQQGKISKTVYELRDFLIEEIKSATTRDEIDLEDDIVEIIKKAILQELFSSNDNKELDYTTVTVTKRRK